MHIEFNYWQGHQWQQFRGPNASGVSEEKGIPVSFGPEKNVLLKTPVPLGNSSPVVAEDRIYLAGFNQVQLRQNIGLGPRFGLIMLPGRGKRSEVYLLHLIGIRANRGYAGTTEGGREDQAACAS